MKKPSVTKLQIAIRKHCLMCVCDSPREIEACTGNKPFGAGTPCPLWPYRFGYTGVKKK